jgi:putative SOS response-associated peptidase YedK
VDARPLRTVTILTGPAPADLAHVHDRAPLVLPPQAWEEWLDPDRGDVSTLLSPTPDGVVVPHPVGPAVGDIRNNGPQLTEAVEVDEQPTLF